MVVACRDVQKKLSILKITRLVGIIPRPFSKIVGISCSQGPTIVPHGQQMGGTVGLWLPLSDFGAISGCSCDTP